MAAESKAEKARRLANEKDRVKKLDPIHKISLYASALILTAGKLVYSVGLFNIQSLDKEGKECFYVPSSFDVYFNDIISAASLVFIVSLYTAVNYFESK